MEMKKGHPHTVRTRYMTDDESKEYLFYLCFEPMKGGGAVKQHGRLTFKARKDTYSEYWMASIEMKFRNGKAAKCECAGMDVLEALEKAAWKWNRGMNDFITEANEQLIHVDECMFE